MFSLFFIKINFKLIDYVFLGIINSFSDCSMQVSSDCSMQVSPDCSMQVSSVCSMQVSFDCSMQVSSDYSMKVSSDYSMQVSFLQKYYQLLLHNNFSMKESKLLLEGLPDSGKTSWMAPFEGRYWFLLKSLEYVKNDLTCTAGWFFLLSSGIIPQEFIAGVTREGKIAGHLINNET